MRWPHQRNAKIRENLAVLTKENTVGMNNLHSAVCGKSQGQVPLLILRTPIPYRKEAA